LDPLLLGRVGKINQYQNEFSSTKKSELRSLEKKLGVMLQVVIRKCKCMNRCDGCVVQIKAEDWILLYKFQKF
jgi:ribosomal protein L14